MYQGYQRVRPSCVHFLKVEEARGDPKFEWSVESVLQVISSTAGQVRWNERLRQFQDLRLAAASAPQPSRCAGAAESGGLASHVEGACM